MTNLEYGRIHLSPLQSVFYKEAKDDSDAEIERIFSRERGWSPAVAESVKALRDSGVVLLVRPVPEPYEEGELNDYFVASDERKRLACISSTGFTPDEIAAMSKDERKRKI